MLVQSQWYHAHQTCVHIRVHTSSNNQVLLWQASQPCPKWLSSSRFPIFRIWFDLQGSHRTTGHQRSIHEAILHTSVLNSNGIGCQPCPTQAGKKNERTSSTNSTTAPSPDTWHGATPTPHDISSAPQEIPICRNPSPFWRGDTLVFSLCKRHFHWHGTVPENREIMRHGLLALVRPATSRILVLLTSVSSPVSEIGTGGAFRVLLAPFDPRNIDTCHCQPTTTESCSTHQPEWLSSKTVSSGITSSSSGNVSSSDVSSSSEWSSCSTKSASMMFLAANGDFR